MPINNAPADVGEASISAVVTRADGTVENLGVISYYNKNPVIHKMVNMWIKYKEAKRSKRDGNPSTK